MCGIHGLLGDDKPSVEKMIQVAKHRGPDGQGTWSDEFITLGHNLLSITDQPSQSSQPWVMEGKVLVYNGEIYNYKDLRSDLDHAFVTDTDTEVLMVGLCKQGAAFLNRCDGMFAIAFYDTLTHDLVLARDENGAKPLYYGNLNGKLAFSSEIKSLLEIGFPRKVDPLGFQLYFYNGHTAGPVTMFKGIKRLVPGEVRRLNLANGEESISNLNDRAIVPFRGDYTRLSEMLRQQLNESVKRTLMGRRQIGVFLSGGLDSSAVLEEMISLGVNDPKTFTTRFAGLNPVSRCNEDSDVALKNAQRLEVSNEQVEVDQQSYVAALIDSLWALEEPRRSISLPAYLATNKAMSEKGIVVTLSGDGGDELLAGYKYHRKADWKARFASFRGGHRQMKNPNLQMSIDEMYDYQQSWIPKGALTGDELNDFMMIECISNLAEDFLIRNDKLGMRYSMEARFPMMSRPFKDFCRSLPGAYKTHELFFGGQGYLSHNKMLLRDAYRETVPSYIIDRLKTGWRAPTEEWVTGDSRYPAPENGFVRNHFKKILSDPEMMDLFDYGHQEIEDRYLNNKNFKPFDPTRFGADGLPKGPHIGLASHKEMMIIIMFAIWYKAFNMSM